MQDVKTEFLFDLKAEFDWIGALDMGTTPNGSRRFFYVKGGVIEGPRIKGVVLPGGGDWPTTHADKSTILDVRIIAHTDDGAVIYVYYRGVSTLRLDTLGRILKGETVDPSEYYFRITPVFETASEKYGWLNRIVAVGIGQVIPSGIAYKVYGIL
jgi:hypothetical protein